MQELGFFLGRFHVLVLHLPIGILIAAVVADWLARRERYAGLAQAAPLLWGIAAIAAIVTVVLGYLHYGEGSFTGPSADAHRLWGTITAVAAVGGWWLATRDHGRAGAARLAAGIVMLVLVSITGHYGGNLTHGASYLQEYAPSFLRGLLGAAPRRSAPTSVAAADPYHDVVAPLLERLCGTCHNDDKLSGSFSIASYDSTLAGGDTGRAVVPGNLDASELFYRVTLPTDDDAFMPAEGKTALTAAQVEIVRWWIAAGAPRDTTVAAVGAPADIEPLIAAELGLGGAASAAPEPAGAASADPAVVAALTAAGLIVRQRSQSDPRLVVSAGAPGARLDERALAAIAAAAPLIVDLNLTDTELDDADLAALGTLPEVTHARLARNRLGDAALAALAAWPSLVYLNVYGNAAIGDSGAAAIGASESLRELYVWRTGVTAAGVAELTSRRPELVVNFGSEISDAAP